MTVTAARHDGSVAGTAQTTLAAGARSERVHVELPLLADLDARSARLLDRRGQPLGVDVALTERDDAVDGRVLTADLRLAALAAGDYVIEITAGAGDRREQRVVAFRVVR